MLQLLDGGIATWVAVVVPSYSVWVSILSVRLISEDMRSQVSVPYMCTNCIPKSAYFQLYKSSHPQSVIGHSSSCGWFQTFESACIVRVTSELSIGLPGSPPALDFCVGDQSDWQNTYPHAIAWNYHCNSCCNTSIFHQASASFQWVLPHDDLDLEHLAISLGFALNF